MRGPGRPCVAIQSRRSLSSAGALDGGEPGAERGVGVGGGGKERLRGGISVAPGVEPAVPIEVPGEVGVGVDQPRQHGAVPEVHQAGPRGHRAARPDHLDAAARDQNVHVRHHGAAAVEHACGTQHDGLLLGGQPSGDADENRGQDAHQWPVSAACGCRTNCVAGRRLSR
jgi:hypothetical protein